MKAGEITAKEVKALLGAHRRRSDAHKGDFGRVLIVAGSPGMAGAAVLCARAALRAGSGLVTVSIDEALWPIVQTAVPEAMCTGRGSGLDLAAYDAAAVGPGLGTGEAARALVARVLATCGGKPLVLDADALNILAASDEVPLPGAGAVLTPHPGEAARLLAGAGGPDGPWRTAADVQKDRLGALAALQGKYGAATVVLKGAGTLVASEASGTAAPEARVNTTGNPGMATGGSGDVLTGVIASLLGQGFAPGEAAAAGVYLHGLAGDLAAAELGEAGVTAGDIALYIAYAMVEAGCPSAGRRKGVRT
ncbi:MAG: NAD(P)H-hydrate dehydratase [Clostridiales Family XIII bacterium]|jgi:NAD(P)H-hydrate epimerase|nr:NAD(P)H-hydrate dehydratase [Clostridiales Family XIII bacterium]